MIRFGIARQLEHFKAVTLPVSPDGIHPPFRPGNRYYIRKKGVLEVGINACADCHTRVMPDGSFLEGAQGIAPRPLNAAVLEGVRERQWGL
jgi:hypothetical protein